MESVSVTSCVLVTDTDTDTEPFPHACYSTHNSAELGSQSMHNSLQGGIPGEDERMARSGVKPEDMRRGMVAGWC